MVDSCSKRRALPVLLLSHEQLQELMGESLVRHTGQNTSGFPTVVGGHREDLPVDVIGA